MNTSKKLTKEFEKGWTELSLKYREWEDMKAKGKMKMKKKINKDGKQYYDFDFSRYQYYYSYPEDHIGLATPPIQRQFIDYVIDKSTENFSGLYLDSEANSWPQLENILKPLQLHQFMCDMSNQLNEKITALRIQKTMRIKKMKGLFGSQNQIQKSTIEFIEAQIRSLMHKQIRMKGKYHKMGLSLNDRLQDHKSYLKTRAIDQLQFSQLTKGDIAVLMRIRQTKQNMAFNCEIIQKIIKQYFQKQKDKIEGIVKQKAAQMTNKKKKQAQIQRSKLSLSLIEKINEMQPTYFDNPDNKQKLQSLIESLDYFKQFQTSVQKTNPSTALFSQHFTTIQLNFAELTYIPRTNSEIRERFAQKIKYYFVEKMIDVEIMNGSYEHICYKVNNLCFLQLKVIWQSYNYAHKKQESALIKIRSMMRKELQLVFSTQVKTLLNIRDHSIKVHGTQQWIPNLLHGYETAKYEGQAQMEIQMKQKDRFRDPTLCSFLELLGVNRDVVVREQIQAYAQKCNKNSKNLYRYRSLYYMNCAADEKTHLINVLNHSLSLNKQGEDNLYTLYYSLMAKVPEQQIINTNFLNSYYMLLFLRCSQTKYQLMEVLNAQLMCMIKVQSRLKLLWQRGSIPFEMSKQFVDRFMEPNDSGANGWNFVTPEANDTHAQSIFKDMYNEDAIRDYIEWNAEIGIQVSRRKSDNPLLQGKSVLYPQTPVLLAEALDRVQYLCSLQISRRQCFLPSAELTQIVDRLQLLLQYLSLQQQFQKSKLKLLDVYHQQLLITSSALGIRLIYEQMSKTMQRNNIADITQPYLANNYKQMTQQYDNKCQILKCLYKKQHNYQLSQSQSQLSNFQRANTSSQLPELSSMYYVEEIAVQERSIIQEQLDDDDPNQSIIQSEDRESVHHNASSVMQGGRNTFSEISSVLESGSQYHIKVSFQQVLSKNQVKAISDQNNKKEQIMNKKKSKIINDSILGANIPRTLAQREKQHLYSFSHFVVHVMHTIDNYVSQFSRLYPRNESRLVFLQAILKIIQPYTFQQYRPLILPQQLPVCLNLGHKALNKFIEKAKTQGGLSSRSSNDHWLCLGSKIIENIISNQTNSEVDEMRGLYLCLNAIHINQIGFKMKQLQRIQNSEYSQYKLLQNTIKSYSTGQIDTKELQLQGFNYYQKRNLSFFKLFCQLKESGQVCQLVAGNYMQYFKAISAYDFAVRNLIVAFNKMFRYQLQELWTLQTQIKMMQKYQCCSRMFQTLSHVPGLQNRVWLRKKLDFIANYQKTIIPKQSVSQLADVLQACCQHVPKFRKIQAKMSLQSTANTVNQFEQYITEIQKSAILINMFAQQICSQLLTHHQIHRIDRLCWMMPSIDKNMHVAIQPNLSALNVFNQHRQHIQASTKKHGKDIKLKIDMDKISVKRIMDYGISAGEGLASWIKEQFWHRNKAEINGDQHKLQFKKHLRRHFPGTVNQIQSQIQIRLQQNLKDSKKYTSLVSLRQWLQTHQLLFGCGLSQSELIKFRKMLINPSIIFPIFWQDNTKHIVSNRQLSKLKSGSLDAQELIQKYRKQYLTYIHLKKIYKNFIDDLAEFQFDQQAPDIFMVLYVGAKQYFKPNEQNWNFLQHYCDSFFQNPTSQIDQFCKFVQNLSITLPIQKNRFQSFQPYKKYYNLSQLKYWIWKQNSKQKSLKRVSESKRFLKQSIIDAKSTAIKPITDEVALPFYKNEKLVQIIKFLQIDIIDYKQAIEEFSRNIDKHILEGMIKLNSKQLYIFNLSQKNMDSRIQLLQAKQQVIKVISANKFYEKLIKQKFYAFCNNLLDNQLSLRKVLSQDLFNEQASRQHKILKQTINKILVPKVKLNPFLSSPLKTQNYFFSGTIKMSYIDQFLNKLRNRAVLIELAEGGTGYLLKVNELDESVDVLCKAIIGFSEKEFADRFRTIFEAIQQIKQRNEKLNQQNNNLKEIIKAVKGYESKEIKSLLYEKLNDYMITFYQQSKNYEIMLSLLKSVENKIEFSLNQKFSQRITSLQKQNNDLRTIMEKYKKQQNNVIKSFTTQVRDTLYEGFKSRAQSILEKNFIEEIDDQQTYEKLEAQDSQVLIKKLKMQKSFYELKIAKIQGIYNERIKNLQKKLIQQSKLQNLLLMEQQKNKSLAKQVKQLQKCSIENQLLKKQMNRKQQEQTMQKFRLVKINQSLKGKLKRVEDENQQQKHFLTTKIQSLSKIQQKSKSSFSVQVSSQDTGVKAKRKSFHIKTQTSSNSQFFDVGLWKDKWMKSQKRLYQIIDIIRKTYEHFIFTKNSAKLIESLKSLLNGFEHRKIESSFSTQK